MNPAASPSEKSLSKEFLSLRKEIEGKPIEDSITLVRSRYESRLVDLFAESVPEIKKVDFRGFINRLRANEFDLNYLDIGLTATLANCGIDPYWKQTYQPRGRMDTKTLGLPEILIYEFNSKSFGEDKPMLDVLWESYSIMMQRTSSPYQQPGLIIPAFTQEHQWIDLDLMGLAIVTENKTFAEGRHRFNGIKLSSVSQATDIEDCEKESWIYRFFNLGRGDPSSANRPLQRFYDNLLEGIILIDHFGNLDSGIGDYLQDATILSLCRMDIEQYAPKVGLRITKRAKAVSRTNNIS